MRTFKQARRRAIAASFFTGLRRRVPDRTSPIVIRQAVEPAISDATGGRHAVAYSAAGRRPDIKVGASIRRARPSKRQILTKRSAVSMSRATSGGVTHCPPIAVRSSSVASRAAAQPFQT